jgi:hypothetical protein
MTAMKIQIGRCVNVTCCLLPQLLKLFLVWNLWKCGPSAGHHTYPDFGQYMPINYFKCFCSVAPYCWSNEWYWYEDSCNVPWDVFLPCLSCFDDKRQHLIKTALMLVDESMSGWCPKTTKLGGGHQTTPMSQGNQFHLEQCFEMV